ncbi:MAG: hypothetical protein K2M47_04525 [Clostridiales bacterium]|nr:hypothetical protein [Clostridiales bacterium]
MKKRRFGLVALSFIFSIFMCVCLVACGGDDDGVNKDGNKDGAKALAAPTVNIDSNGNATWNEVTNASGYAFKIDDGTEQTAEEGEVKLENGQSVAVKAKGDGVGYVDSKWSTPKTYRAPANKLTAPENLTAVIEGTDAGKVILNWNAVQGADCYKYVINGDEGNAVTVDNNSATVDLSEIDASRLDSTWTFQVKAIVDDMEEIADDGDYSNLSVSSEYCGEVEFAIADDEIYTVAEILKIMNYYGENLPTRDFMITGTIETNGDGDAVLENGFTLFGDYVPELYLAIDERLVGLDVTAIGTLVADGTVKGLSSYRSVDFDGIAENDRYALVIETLNAWDMLKEDSRIMGDFYLPTKLYGVNILWDVDDDDTGAFAMDDYGNVTVTCPASGADDIPVMLTALLYVDSNHMYDEDELTFMFAITSDTRIQLNAPKINIDPKTGVATWNKIEHAIGYRVVYYGFSVPGDYYSDYVSKDIIIAAEDNRSVQLKDTWWISVQALGDGIVYKNSEVDPKQYNYYPETVEPDGTPLEFDLTKLTQTGELSNANYIFGLACGNSSVFVSASGERVVLGNDDSNGVVTGTGFIKVGSAKNSGKITLTFNKKITGVVITARQWNKDQKDKISVNGSEQQTASKNDWGIMYFNFTANKASTTVEIDTDNRVFIQSIVVYVAD